MHSIAFADDGRRWAAI